ncbi:TonB-dependent receptor [Gallaecimonas mangrovi]|uniref:TonB-dependent receptor n=1 Tax=Gallaecimonas mangrovi TaxID=2291597 RepID=UPI000E205D9A|nr:TonB-dependent receptor [Gallaecimonas mangrovi]
MAQSSDAAESQAQNQDIAVKSQSSKQPEKVSKEKADKKKDTETITVTGTRIQRAEYSSNSPVSTIDAKEMKMQGTTNVEEALSRMPQFTADNDEYVSNGSDGTAQINLRNLGSNRVLTLINGQRILPTMAMDMNFIPSSLVKRVDVVTGGASAVYGSDAISGVVNFIMKDNLQGFTFDTQASTYQHNNDNSEVRSIVSDAGYDNADSSVWDGEKYNFSLAGGTNFLDGRGNITFYGTYRKTNPVTQDQRDYSACALSANSSLNGYACSGSSNNPYGRFYVLDGDNAGADLANAKDGSKTFNDYDSSYLYNYTPLNYTQREDKRYTAGYMAHYDFDNGTRVTSSVMYMHDRSFSQVAPSALWFGSDFSINCDNPLMSDQQAEALCGSAAGTSTDVSTYVGYRLDGENSRPRRDDLQHSDYRFTLGVNGDITDNITYNASYLHSEAHYSEQYQNDVDQTKAANALLAVTDSDGNVVCQSVVDGTDPDCVPLDVFSAEGSSMSDAALDYILTTSETNSKQTMDVYSAYSQIDLDGYGIKVPWANLGPALVVGGEHRREMYKFNADAVSIDNGYENSYGVIKVDEAYTELDVPLVEDAPGVKYLGVNGGYRYSSYKNHDDEGDDSKYNANTFKFELTYAPNDDVRFRGSFNKAIRAPNVTELFASQSLGNYSGTDPCAGSDPTATMAECENTGVSSSQYGSIVECPSDQCVAQYGGNPDLKPETAKTLTLGVVLTPQFIPNFSLSIDYYHIKVDDYISSVDPTLILSQCLNTGDSYYCNLIHRNPSSGALFGTTGYVVSTTLNTGYLRTSGFDVNTNYDLDLNGLGSLNFNLVGSLLTDMTTEPLPGYGSYNCKGLYGPTCGLPQPEWRHNARVSWSTPWYDLDVSLMWRYIGKVDLSSNTDNPLLASDDTYYVSDHIGSYSYFDLSGSMPVTDNIQVRAGINNMFDRDPPIIVSDVATSYTNGNTYPGVYDPLGRQIFLGVTAKF